MAYLEALNGPDAGRRYELAGPSIVLGRHPECDIVIEVGAVSRQHAKLIRVGSEYLLEDLKSRNGTYLNEQPVLNPHALVNGDRIQVCDVVLQYHDERRPMNLEDSSFGAMLVDDEPGAGSTIMSTLEVATGTVNLQIAASAEAKLNALLEINRSLGRRLALDQVLPQVLESLFKIFMQADRGFIILRDARGNLVPRWTKLRREDNRDALRISRTIVSQVIESKEAILSADAASDQRFQMSQSIADFRIRSMMCAPLINSDGEAFGVLQIDTLDQRKRFQPDDLEVLAAVAAQAGVVIDNAQLYEQALRQREVDRDLELARQVQRGFLPHQPPDVPSYQFFDFYQPANKVGGDYYDYIQLPDGRVAIVVADVVGHGVAAALLMAKLSSQVRFSLASGAEPAAALTAVNRAFGEIGLEDRFVTMVLAVLDPKTNQLTLANAGHMAPFLRRKEGDVIDLGEEHSGLPLGITPDYEYEQFAVLLAAGETLAMYTDGLNEAMNTKAQLYTIERLRKQFATAGQGVAQLGQGVIADLRRFMHGAGQNDDMCLVCLGRA